MNQFPMRDRVALVTGVSRRVGIGYAIAHRLAALGADLFLHGYTRYDAQQPWGADAGGPEAIIASLRSDSRQVAYAETDLLEPLAPSQLVASAVERFGHVDILIANHAYGTTGDLEAITAADIDVHLQVNVRATLLLVQTFAAQHDGRRGGRVVLMTSGQHRGPMPSELAYAASKGALHQITPSLSAHLIRQGITVNCVNPGATDTGYATPELYEAIRAMEPQGRWGQPEDAARLICWLASDDACWITGQVIDSTGGGP